MHLRARLGMTQRRTHVITFQIGISVARPRPLFVGQQPFGHDGRHLQHRGAGLTIQGHCV